MPDFDRGAIAFEGPRTPRADGYRVKATYGQSDDAQNALIEIWKHDALVKSTLWPAYKVWNVAAHFDDICADLESGLSAAGATGFGGNVYQEEQ